MENKNSFILHKSFYEPIKNLTFEEKGELFDLIFQYQINPNNPLGFKHENVKMAFEFFRNQFNYDNEKYQNIVQRNRTNGLKGGRPKNPLGFEKPKKPDNDNVNENDKKVIDAFSSAKQEAWNTYSPSYLKSLGISDPAFIERARHAFVGKSRAATENAVQVFINNQKKFTPPDTADYVADLWPEEVQNG